MPKTLRTTALFAVAVLILGGGFALGAGAAGHFGSGGLLGGHGHGHGSGHSDAEHAHQAVAELIDSLDLTSGQQLHVDAIHEALMARHKQMATGHREHLAVLIERIDGGTLDAAEAREVVTAHLDAIEETAHTVTDELVPLINSLDDEQRAILVDHLRQVQTLGNHLDALH